MKVKKLRSTAIIIMETLVRGFVKFLSFPLSRYGFTIKLLAIETHKFVNPAKELLPPVSKSRADWSIVIQGGVESDEQVTFLAQTLDQIRRDFCFHDIVLSTFNSMSPKITSTIEKMCARYDVILGAHSDPGQISISWASNLLRQIQSTSAGLNLLRSPEVRRVIKLRVDQRIENPDCLKLIDFLQSTYERNDSNNRGRIFSTSFNSFKTRPLFLSDMLHFGYLSDLKQFWKPVKAREYYESRQYFQQAFSDQSSPKLFDHPEVWLSTRYALHHFPKVNSLTSLNSLFWAQLAGVVDSLSVGQEWLKLPSFFGNNYRGVPWFDGTMALGYSEMRMVDWIAHIDLEESPI